MPEPSDWVTLHHPEQQVSHRVPNTPAVIEDFRARGWVTVDEAAARAEEEAAKLRGHELDEALEAADLPTSGKVAEKQARLAEARAEQVNTRTEGTEV